MKQMVRDARFWICGLFVLVIVLVAVFAPWLSPKDPNAMDAKYRLKGPGGPYLLGTDEFGRDILGRLIHGARLSLFISLSTVAIAALMGSTLGMTAAYSGGNIESLIMRLVDVVLCFPPILLALFVVVFIGAELRNLVLTIGVLYLPRFIRVIHGVTLSVKETEYVEAARVIGSPGGRILFRTILPNVMAPVMVMFSLNMGNAILLESSLSFIGLGIPPPAVAWGRMISQSSHYMHLNPYAVIWPAVAIAATVIAFNILGDAVRDALDPRLRGR